MDDSIHVKGLADLQKFLDTLAPRIEANVLRGALMAGLKPIVKAARNNIHSVSGELAKSFKRSSRRQGGKVTAKLSVGNGFGVKGKPPRNLPLWVEYGTRPHRIPKLSKKNAHLLINGHFASEANHPGAKPHPFMRVALDQQASAAVVAAAEYMRNRLATKEGLNAASDIEIGVEE